MALRECCHEEPEPGLDEEGVATTKSANSRRSASCASCVCLRQSGHPEDFVLQIWSWFFRGDRSWAYTTSLCRLEIRRCCLNLFPEVHQRQLQPKCNGLLRRLTPPLRHHGSGRKQHTGIAKPRSWHQPAGLLRQLHAPRRHHQIHRGLGKLRHLQRSHQRASTIRRSPWRQEQRWSKSICFGWIARIENHLERRGRL